MKKKPEFFLGSKVEYDNQNFIWGLTNVKRGTRNMVAMIGDLGLEEDYTFECLLYNTIAEAINLKLHNKPTPERIPISVKNFITSPVKYHSKGTYISFEKEGEEQELLVVRGWGSIQHMFSDLESAAAYQDSVGEYIVDAINNYLNFI
jgi:hypothetical protein